MSYQENNNDAVSPRTKDGIAKFDEAKAESFAGKMLDILNHGTLALMISIGHQTRLFDVMASMPSSSSSFSTSTEIAKAANLNERYVREWLGAMVTGGIVEYNPENAGYKLPPEHTALLTRAGGLDNMAVFMQYIALMGNVEQEIIECFRKGGGVPYSKYPRFQELQAEETARIYDARLIGDIIPLVSGLTEKLTAGINVLDVGCGRGHAINVMAKAFPKSAFVGYDFSRGNNSCKRRSSEEWTCERQV